MIPNARALFWPAKADEPNPAPPIDQQDPLPESNWFFRRIALLGSLVVLFVHRTWEVYRANYDAHWTDYLILAVLVLYTVAPSAEQIGKIIATVSLLKPTVIPPAPPVVVQPAPQPQPTVVVNPSPAVVSPTVTPSPAPAPAPNPAPCPPANSLPTRPPWETNIGK